MVDFWDLIRLFRLIKPVLLPCLAVIVAVYVLGGMAFGLVLGPAMLWAHFLDPNLPRLVQLPLLLLLLGSFAFFFISWKPWRSRPTKASAPESGTHGSAAWGDPSRLCAGSGLIVGRSPGGAGGLFRSGSAPLLRYGRGLHS